MLHAYKPGQGYWTRLMSAIGFGMLVAAGAFWAWSTIEGKVEVPMDSWTMGVEVREATVVDQAFPIGAEVSVKGTTAADAEPDGTAVVVSASRTGTNSADVVLRDLLITGETVNAQGLQQVVGANGRGFTILARVGTPAFNKQYLQGGVAIGVLVIGGFLVLWFCYLSKRTGEFLIATEGEMKKVNWSSRREVFGSTWVVIIVSLAIGAILFVADLYFSTISTKLGILDGAEDEGGLADWWIIGGGTALVAIALMLVLSAQSKSGGRG